MDILETFEAEDWGDLFDRAAAPTIRIILILIVAEVVIKLGKKALERSAARAGRGEPAFLQKLESRTGLEIAEDVDPVTRVRRERRAAALAALAGSVLTVLVWSIAVMMVLAEFGINLGPIIASAGIVGVALGFGAQDLVKDFLSGVFILAEGQYGVGDVVDVGEATGTVEGVTLRSTRLRDVEGTLWHVPNGEIRRVGNMSQEWARTLVDVDVAYDTDLPHAKDVILRTARALAEDEEWASKVLEPPEMWGVEELGADGIKIRIVIKVLPGEQWGVSREFRQRVKAEFDREGIEIPFPQRTLWVRSTTADADGLSTGSGAPDRDGPPSAEVEDRDGDSDRSASPDA